MGGGLCWVRGAGRWELTREGGRQFTQQRCRGRKKGGGQVGCPQDLRCCITVHTQRSELGSWAGRQGHRTTQLEERGE